MRTESDKTFVVDTPTGKQMVAADTFAVELGHLMLRSFSPEKPIASFAPGHWFSCSLAETE